MKKRILVNDPLAEAGLDILVEAGFKIDKEKKDPAELLSQISEYDGLIVRSGTTVTHDMLEAAGNLVVGRVGTGLDNIAVETATKQGIPVFYTPGINAPTVAALATKYILQFTFPDQTRNLSEGIWDKESGKEMSPYGKTLGVIGYGNIGSVVGNIGKSFGMEVIAYDPPLANKPEGVTFTATQDELLENSDIVSLHVSGINQIIGTNELNQMKNSAYLINTARGSLVNPKSVHWALKEEIIQGYAADVFVDEPNQSFHGASLQAPPSWWQTLAKDFGGTKFFGSPHIGGASKEVQVQAGIELANLFVSYLKDNAVLSDGLANPRYTENRR